jgi:MoxR-like ATPase
MAGDLSKTELMGRPLSDREEAEFVEKQVERMSDLLSQSKEQIASEVWGQDKVIEDTLICMVAGGHLLSVGAPGLAKTRLVSRVSTVMGLDYNRVQFTPDLMPSDILGSEILTKDASGKDIFEFIQGPVFTQFLMADEINRAGPRTQSALLEAMQERKVTVAGRTYNLRRPFTVMATQNPLEQEGTYPLPEAQLDRFLMKLDVDYPTREAEERVMIQTTGTGTNLSDLFARSANGEDLTISENKDDISKVKAVLEQNDLILMQTLAKRLPLTDNVVDATMQLVRNARPNTEDADEFVRTYIQWGPGPRAVQAFASAAKARALMEGRLTPSVDDVLELIDPVLEHRMALTATAEAEGITFGDVKKHLTKNMKLKL